MRVWWTTGWLQMSNGMVAKVAAQGWRSQKSRLELWRLVWLGRSSEGPVFLLIWQCWFYDVSKTCSTWSLSNQRNSESHQRAVPVGKSDVPRKGFLKSSIIGLLGYLEN